MTKQELRLELHKIFPEWKPISLPFQKVEKLFERYYASNSKVINSRAITWIDVSKKKPTNNKMVMCTHLKDNWTDIATWHKSNKQWDNGECEIYPTHWAIIGMQQGIY